MREIAKQSKADHHMVVFAIAIFVCVFLGPFETGDDLAFWDRFVFWTIAVVIVGICMEYCISATIKSHWLKAFPTLLTIAIGAAMGSIPGTSFVVVLNKVFRPDHHLGTQFPVLLIEVAIMSILIAGLAHLINSRLHGGGEGFDTSSETFNAASKSKHQKALKTARLFQRLPTRLREGQVISLSMQDHYVDVTTTHGNEMILMRLADAIDLLDGMPGVQTHRSHWAAKAHSKALTRVSRRYQLTLSDGRTIPVSTRYKDAVEQMMNEKGQT